jgi:hypothetical protein
LLVTVKLTLLATAVTGDAESLLKAVASALAMVAAVLA